MNNNNSIPRPHLEDCDIKDFGQTKCQVHLAKSCDINTIINRALAGDTSVIRRGSFVDATVMPDSLQEALNLQIKAADSYAALPQSVRDKYRDPMSFFAAAHDPDRRKEFVELGLAFERTPEGPIEVKVVNSSPSKTDTSSTEVSCA